MKKTIGKMLAIVMVLGMFVGCSSFTINKDQPRHVSIPSIIEKIKRELELSPMEVVEGDLVSEKYHLNMEDVEDQRIESGVGNTELETIAIVKAKDQKIDAVKEAFEKVIEDKRASALYPEESAAVSEAKIRVVGNYVGLFILPDYEEGIENKTEKAVEIFEKGLR